tara:strand:+ start:149 stop:472 length:324 start_codon:yes stop_codon:yes gene_type:complete
MDISVEGDLKTIVNFVAKGKKTAKKYDAFVIEGFHEKYITVDVEELSDSPLVLKWDSFMYSGEIFGNKLSCDYKVKRNFTATKVTQGSDQPSVVAKRKVSGRPISQQ